MPRYAEGTSVPVERSRDEIEKILKKYDASMFGYGWGDKAVFITFCLCNRRIKFVLPLVGSGDLKGIQRNRESWRALVLVIKAKLEAVNSGITTVEHEFLAHIIFPDGSTVGEWLQPQLEQIYRSNEMPRPVVGLLEASNAQAE